MTTTASHLRDAALTAQENHADPRLILAVDAVIEDLINSGRPWSADDIRPLVPTLALPLVGGRVRSYLMRRNPQRLVCVGEIQSTWPASHGKRVGLYVGAEHAEAVAS